MIRTNSIILIFMGIILLAFAPSTWADQYQGSLRYSLNDLTIDSSMGFDVIHLKNGDYTRTTGAPTLPAVQVNIALPTGAIPQTIQINRVEQTELTGSFDIMPRAKAIPISTKPTHDPLIKDPAFYTQNANYPGEYAELTSTWDLAGQEFVTVTFYPVQYNPVSQKITVATYIDYEVLYEKSRNAERKTYNFSKKLNTYFREKLKSLATNPDDISSFPRHTTSRLSPLDPGTYEYVIITTSSFKNSFQPLADWRTQMGIPANIVTLDWIYANYTGSTNQEKIRNFVIDANSTWGTLYFLMGGDTGYVPYHSKSLDGDNIPNDTYFADYDNDRKYEVYVGRASVNNTTQINTFVNKVFTYEKNPPANYGNKVFFMGFNLDSSTKGEKCKETIKNQSMPGYASIVQEYDSESGGHESDVKNYLNQGQNLVNHIDHADTGVIGVGSSHNTYLSKTESQNISNGTKLSNLYTIGCWPGNFANTCWGETFVRDDQGGITFTGNSRYGWYSPGNTNSLSLKYDQLWWEALYVTNAYRAGETLASSLNKLYPTGTTFFYIFTELNLLGDPALHFWTKNPVNLTALHDSSTFTGTQTFNVNVSDLSTPIEDALVCLMKGNEVYAYGTTNASGDANLSINPTSTGTMTVTVTAQNYKYYEGSVIVSQGTQPPVIYSISPLCGPEAGGTLVTVTGDNFTINPSMAVSIGGSACTGINVLDSTTLTCNTPAGVNGWHEVFVENSNGNATLPATSGFRYFPVTHLPFNGSNIPSESLNTPVVPTLIVSGNPMTPFISFFSLGGGPMSTPFGNAGLSNPFYNLFTSVIGSEGYFYLPLSLPAGYGPLDIYIHVLGLDNLGKPLWAYGGNNPNATGSIWFHLNN